MLQGSYSMPLSFTMAVMGNIQQELNNSNKSSGSINSHDQGSSSQDTTSKEGDESEEDEPP
ncbi:hypothetical protein EV182_007063, partial [Spiromyces aspiralis]